MGEAMSEPIDIDAMGYFWCRVPHNVAVQMGGETRLADLDVLQLTAEVRRLRGELQDAREKVLDEVLQASRTWVGTMSRVELAKLVTRLRAGGE